MDLLIEAITLPEGVQQAINRAAGTRAVGQDEVSRYTQVVRSNALQDAVRQPGGGAAAELMAGLGLGAGMQIAREMIARPPGTPPPAGTPKLTPDELKAKLRELKDLLEEGLIDQADFDGQKKRLLEQV